MSIITALTISGGICAVLAALGYWAEICNDLAQMDCGGLLEGLE